MLTTANENNRNILQRLPINQHAKHASIRFLLLSRDPQPRWAVCSMCVLVRCCGVQEACSRDKAGYANQNALLVLGRGPEIQRAKTMGHIWINTTPHRQWAIRNPACSQVKLKFELELNLAPWDFYLAPLTSSVTAPLIWFVRSIQNGLERCPYPRKHALGSSRQCRVVVRGTEPRQNRGWVS